MTAPTRRPAGPPMGGPGARMMGGGFGGCTINLVKADNVDNFIADLSSQYELAQQRTLKAYTVSVEDGAGIIS